MVGGLGGALFLASLSSLTRGGYGLGGQGGGRTGGGGRALLASWPALTGAVSLGTSVLPWETSRIGGESIVVDSN